MSRRNPRAHTRVVLDLDGVILDSERIKLAMFRRLFADEPAALVDQIDKYNRSNRGVPRSVKFQHVLTRILKRPDEGMAALEARYSQLLLESLGDVPLMPGLADLIALSGFVFYVNSSAPRAEIDRALRRHGLEDSFSGVFGFPDTKVGALKRLRDAHSGLGLVFIGDAAADLEAARIAAVPFIAAVLGEHHEEFEGHVPRIYSFLEYELVCSLIERVAASA